ncbi:hypothetical protein AUL39_01525 [Tractidigestivibacter scatoligenes]|uniref:Zinc-ribbon domain-containing protein n=1 Tax=Tractidigestivibacter scatoligenes TaxID=1299998 RepID=A0A100YX47_TRASO|nr:zinc ribbon domain-containing protein [Tractidigestivibacter scatoligenes]KUH59042.1 hypothetical protein AUL39_01525 [Tractidigestivibacter scatoligenes]
MFCPQCGKKLAGTEKFCPNCGYNLAMPPRSASEAHVSQQAQLHPVQPVVAPALARTAVSSAELVTLAAALLIGIAAFLPFLVVSGATYDYSVALTDAPDGAVLVLLAIATAVLPMVHRNTASLVLSSITTAFSLFEVCSVSFMLLTSTWAAYYVNLGAGFCLLALGIVMGVFSIVLLARDLMREKHERQRVMGSFIPANGTTQRQQ